MHMHRDPQTMQISPMSGDVVPQVLRFLEQRSAALRGLGVDLARICVDPGVGFGKTVAQNFSLLQRQRELILPGQPYLVGWSRKSSLGAVTGLDAQHRLIPSVAAALLAVERGAHVVRVHDVDETVQALKIWQAARSPIPTS
jgi:dihydropteroate synthase